MTQLDYADGLPAADLQPIFDAIIASVRGAVHGREQEVCVTLPSSSGQTVLVSIRSGASPPALPARPRIRGLDARQLRLVYGAIDERISEPISVSMLSAVAGLSRSHFSNAFRATVGRPPHAHVLGLRIERAKRLMLESDAPLSEVALSSGFSDQAHFSNSFRRATGLTPSQWRRTHRDH